MVRLIVADAERAHAWLRQQSHGPYVRDLVARGVPPDVAAERAAAAVSVARPALGALYGESDLDCPDGLANCRNCGDPEFESVCRGAGHCARCGVLHGTAPDAVLRAHGLTLA